MNKFPFKIPVFANHEMVKQFQESYAPNHGQSSWDCRAPMALAKTIFSDDEFRAIFSR